MKSLNINRRLSNDAHSPLIDHLRSLRDQSIERFQFRSAIFFSDKILALTGMNAKDGLPLAYSIYLLRQYQRAAHLILANNLHMFDIKCRCLLVKCLIKNKKFKEAINLIDDWFRKESISKDEKLSPNHVTPLLIFKSEACEALDNRLDARQCLIQALEQDFRCYEAFYRITHHHLASKQEELELLSRLTCKNNIHKLGADENFFLEFLSFFYYIQLKKYDKPDKLILNPSFRIFEKNNDYLIALAQRHFYNFDSLQALEITSSVIEKDPLNFECLEIHLSCYLTLEKSIELFKLSQNLINFYPDHEITWFALGCYYHLIQKKEISRRYLEKAVTLNPIFAPAWILFGCSFSDDAEHDQVMAAYFKASHLMPGCHLPLLYIGVEYVRTDNHKLGEKFIMKALSIAPEDPIVLHELSVTAFHSNEYMKADRFLRQAIKIIHYPEIKDNKQCLSCSIEYEPLFNNMGHIQRKLGRNNDAVNYFQLSLTLLPNNPSTYASLGLVFCLLDKYAEAVDYLEQAYGMNRLSKRDDLIKLLEDALKYYPDYLKFSSSELAVSKVLPWSSSVFESKLDYVRRLTSEESSVSSAREIDKMNESYANKNGTIKRCDQSSSFLNDSNDQSLRI
ncbi:transcription factor CBF/NF-Y/archaeal histone -2 [Sarcoptes scabiei]|nr:transcription factor CBF/NF-Y/archaeal histone -2 [Sarcoptes scabiei]